MKKNLIYLIIAVFATLGVASCGDSDYYYEDPIVGRWALQTVNGLPPSQEIDYSFFSNYTGAITYNAGYVNQYQTPFEWETSVNSVGQSYVVLYNYNAAPFSYRYFIEMRALPGYGRVAYLILLDLDTGDRLEFQAY